MRFRKVAVLLLFAIAVTSFWQCSKSKMGLGGTGGVADTLVFIGSPKIDSSAIYLALSAAMSNGTAVPISPSQLVLQIDSVRSFSGTHSVYTVDTTRIVNVSPTSGKTLACHMLFDASGSMSSSDPTNLRTVAGKEFVNKLAQASASNSCAVAEFGNDNYSTDEYYYHLLTSFVPCSDTTSLYPGINALGAWGSTPMYTGLRRSLEHTDSAAPASTYSRGVLVFTDGLENDSYPGDTLGTIIADANSRNIPIYAIGLGPNVDMYGLQTLATQTNGIYAQADSANSLIPIYTAMGLGISGGYTQVTGRLNQKAYSGDIFYLTVTLTGQSRLFSQQFVVVVMSTTSPKRIARSKVG